MSNGSCIDIKDSKKVNGAGNEKISVIIPAYNEEKNIKSTLEETIKVFGGLNYDFELIVVDDGSKDKTYNTVKRYIKETEKVKNKIKIKRYERNTGKGFALKYGTGFASGSYILFMDADLDLHPSNIKDFFDTLRSKRADVVTGSKRNKNTLLIYPKVRKILSIFYYNLIKCLFRLPIRDTQTGFKLFKSEALKDAISRTTIRGFAFDLELIMILNKKGYKIIEYPIKIKPKGEHKRISIGNVFKVFLDTVLIFYRLYLKRWY
jgi:dolichol-phosphate mannosyltransferase